jgi:hypothetical protein
MHFVRGLCMGLGGKNVAMTYHVTHRYGAMETELGFEAFPKLLAELDARELDAVHAEVSLTHESEWCIAASASGTVTFENLESGEPRHIPQMSASKIIELWRSLAVGDLEAIEREAWQPGYG